MAGVVVYLNGGPCDGTEKTLTAKQYASKVTTCKNIVYKYDAAAGKSFELPVFSSQDSNGAPADVGGLLKGPHALSGWKALRKSVNRGMPEALNVMEKSRHAALRSLRRASKVRG